jgi:hypothetical protein
MGLRVSNPTPQFLDRDMAFSTTFDRSPRHKWAGVCTVTTFALIFLLYLTYTTPPERTLNTIPWMPTRPPSSIRIAKATVAYTPTSLRSLTLHTAHNDVFGYPMHVLRTPIVRGFANPLLWLQQIIVGELVSRTAEQRTEWIMFFDSTIVLTNARIPLHMFVPPHELSYLDAFKGLTIIATKHNSVDMDTSVFFIRVSSLSLRFFTVAMNAVYDAPKREWGGNVMGAAMQEVLEREEWREHVVWVAREWRSGKGAMFKRVEGVVEMDEVLSQLEMKVKEAVTAVFPAEDDFEGFWHGVLEAKQVLVEARDRGYAKDDGEFAQEYRDVKDTAELWTWDLNGLRKKVESLKQAMHIGEMIGYETVTV